MNSINTLINELIRYGMKNGLVAEEDKVYTTNRLLELFELLEYQEENSIEESGMVQEDRPLQASTLR